MKHSPNHVIYLRPPAKHLWLRPNACKRTQCEVKATWGDYCFMSEIHPGVLECLQQKHLMPESQRTARTNRREKTFIWDCSLEMPRGKATGQKGEFLLLNKKLDCCLFRKRQTTPMQSEVARRWKWPVHRTHMTSPECLENQRGWRNTVCQYWCQRPKCRAVSEVYY